MNVKILFFAAVRDAVGRDEECAQLPDDVRTVTAVRAWLAARGDAWQALAADRPLRAALNQRMAKGDEAVSEGDELAFFPPVTGG